MKTAKCLVFLSCVLLSSCASIFKGAEQDVTIDSNVHGADIRLNGELIGTTPFSGKIKKQNDARILLSAKGHESREIILDTSIEPFWFGNLIFGGAFGSTTDYSTGAMYQYAPGNIVVDLHEVSEGN